MLVLLHYKYHNVRTIKLSIFNLTNHVCVTAPSKEQSPTQICSCLCASSPSHTLSLLKSHNNQVLFTSLSLFPLAHPQWNNEGAGMSLHEEKNRAENGKQVPCFLLSLSSSLSHSRSLFPSQLKLWHTMTLSLSLSLLEHTYIQFALLKQGEYSFEK